MQRPISTLVRERGIYAYATEAEWRRSNRVAYYFMARGLWKESTWPCMLLAVRFLTIFVFMTIASFVLRQEIPTWHSLRIRRRSQLS